MHKPHSSCAGVPDPAAPEPLQLPAPTEAALWAGAPYTPQGGVPPCHPQVTTPVLWVLGWVRAVSAPQPTGRTGDAVGWCLAMLTITAPPPMPLSAPPSFHVPVVLVHGAFISSHSHWILSHWLIFILLFNTFYLVCSCHSGCPVPSQSGCPITYTVTLPTPPLHPGIVIRDFIRNFKSSVKIA